MNIVLTSTSDSVKAEFNAYSNDLGMEAGTWRLNKIESIIKINGYIRIYIQGEKEWLVSFDGASGSLIIDSINTVAPISNADLYTKLTALIA